MAAIEQGKAVLFHVWRFSQSVDPESPDICPMQWKSFIERETKRGRRIKKGTSESGGKCY